MAALLSIGPDAVLSHRSAAALWAIRATARERIDVTVPRALPPRTGIELHRATLPPDEITTHHDIPVTTLPRTLLDVAAVIPPHQLERAANEADVQRLADPLTLDDLLERHPRRKGAGAIRALIEEHTIGQAITRSDLESAFLAFLDEAALPRPETNVRLELSATRAVEVDCLWQNHNLIAELDGRTFHATTRAFEHDRAKDRALVIHGWRVIRITWRQLQNERTQLVADLRCLLRLP